MSKHHVLRTGRRSRATGAALAAVLAIASLVPAASASAAGALRCDQSTVYAIGATTPAGGGAGTTGVVRRVDLAGRTTSPVTRFAAGSNALGIARNGTVMYAAAQDGTALDVHDPVQDTTTTVPITTRANAMIIRGAVNPVTGVYYFATGGTTIDVYAYAPDGRGYLGRVATISGVQDGNGDFAFSSSGVLFLAAQDEVLRVDEPLPTTAGAVALTATVVVDLPASTRTPGIAFSSDGHLFIASGTDLVQLDPGTGREVGRVPVAPPAGTSYAISDLASCDYANTVTGTASVDERVRAGDQFTVTLTGGGTAGPGGSATSAGTASSVTAGPVLALAGTRYTATQTASGTTRPAEYTTTWSCASTSDPGAPPLASGDGGVGAFTMPPSRGTHGTDVTCAFTNTPKRVPLRVVSALAGPRADDADQFVVAVRDAGGTALSGGGTETTAGSGSSVTGGTGDSGATAVVVSREHRLTQALAPGSAGVLAQYTRTVDCVDATGTQTGLPRGAAFTGALAITPVLGSDITCTVTAAPVPAAVAVVTTLGDPRFADGDQFTAAIHEGTAAGPVVGSTGGATTTGTGDAVGAGTGTSALAPAAGRSPYALTHVATADGGRYRRTVACRDRNGFQRSGLPSGAFGDGVTVTPVAGADITCTVDVVLAGSGLRVDTLLADPRFAPGDQFTAAIHAGGPDGPVLGGGAGAPTTTGSGADVDAGTGTTGRVGTTRDAAYTITHAAGSDADRYRRTVTCVDLAEVQRGLPRDAPFTDALTIRPEPGADLVCTVTVAAREATVTVSAELASERFAAGDQLTVGLQDGAGVELGRASSSTTTGTGSAVDAGTGTTGAVVVAPNRPYALLGGVAGDTARYDRTIRCTEASGLRAGLPDGAFDGSEPFTPQAGTAVACVVTAALRPAVLTASAALASARADDGDQWSLAWRTGGADGAVVGDTAAATTRGTGGAVAAGSGTTRLTGAAGGVAHTLTQAVSAHADRYATRLTCTDAAGLQTGLPADAAFRGSAAVIPEAGADVRCVLTARLLPGALALQLTAPAAAQVGAAATWTATLTNGGGAPVTSTAAFALPDGFAYRGVRGTDRACTLQAATVTCTGPALAGGATDAFDIDLVPAAGTEGAAVLRAAVDPAGAGAATDPAACTAAGAPAAGCAVARTVVGSSPRLVLGVTAPDALAVGAAATWRVTVANEGTGPAGSAVVALRLPDGVGAISAAGADCTISGRDARCAVPGPIAAGRTVAFSLTGTPTEAAAGTAPVLRGRLDPAGSTTTGDPAACTATDGATGCAVARSGTVASGVVLGITITPPTRLTEGVPAGYAVVVANTGTGPAAAPTVAVRLPAALQYRAASGASCTATAGDLVCTLAGALPAGGSAGFVVTAVPADGSAGTAVAPVAAVDPAGVATPRPASGCPAGGRGCAAAPPRTIERAGALVLSGTVTPLAPDGDRLVAGDRVRYSFTVVNRTGAAVRQVSVTVPGLGRADCRAGSLAAGAATACVLPPVTVTQAQVDAGTVARDAVASAVPAGCTGGCPPVASNRITLTAPVRTLARIVAAQTVRLHDRNGDGVAQRGERVTFAVRVTNAGTVTLRGVTLDDEAVALTCPRSVLRVGESMVCTGDHVTTVSDVAAGGIRNLATARATGVARLDTVTSQRTVGTVEAHGSSARLARTGSNLPAGVLAGVLLLGAGGALLLGGRRRRRAA